MKKTVVVAALSAVIGSSSFAYDYAPTGSKTKHSNDYGMKESYGQYPQIVDGSQNVQKVQLAESLYKKALALDAKKDGFDSTRTQAVQLWEEAASFWHEPSNYEAGFAYYVGYGVDVDVPKANTFLEYAAKREHRDGLGLYLVSQVYDSKYRKLRDNELLGYIQKSVFSDNNIYGLLAFLKLHQDGTIKNQSQGRQKQIKDLIKRRLQSPNANRVERYHVPVVISTLKINLD